MTNVRNILFFGDSLTAGYGLGNHKAESFPALIQQKIDAAGLVYHCINGGLSGDTTAGGLMRLEYWMNRPLHVFVLELGVNDIIRGISPQTTTKNIQAIIDKVKLKHPNIKLVMLGMEIPAFIPGKFAAEFKAIFRRVADANQMAFVPFYLDGVAGKAHLNLPDGLHPNAAGYKVMADSVWPVLKALL
ncbi:arylesterase [Mucilaginibacter ginsenosidivorax]|uniref:Arylesterase n=1 Tax=Mucilaginibacter ginsenosidivorax TaxID=862126 RepID=A0A5B8W3F6_9SPHI|nr:arylesterase [Mucilaginibacter ginsenosidivorax]QEC78321.1 arylesterase [Mucilaginibacter ginsenosidivorax]